MTTFWWVVAGVLTTFLAVAMIVGEYVGLISIVTGRVYQRCPRCHHLYSTPYDQPEAHACPHGRVDRAYQWGWSHLHHAST
jgi:hypothetical protein